MDPDTARSLRRLLATRPVASLATLHQGEPALSMVPFVLPAGDTRLYIHVSALGAWAAASQARAGASQGAGQGAREACGGAPTTSVQRRPAP